MAYNKFAESVINGAYKPREVKENNTPQSNNSFADSVINGTYKPIQIQTQNREPITTPPVQTNAAKETIQAQTQPTTQPIQTTQTEKTPLVYEGASINPNASEEEKLRIIANNNLKQKQGQYDTTYENLKNKRQELLTEKGISNDPMVKYNEATLDERLTKPTKEEAKVSGEEGKKYLSVKEDIENATKDEGEAFSNAYNQLKYAKYLKNVSDVQQEDTNIVDQTLGNLTRGAMDILSNFSEDNRFVDENGNVQYLPSYNALKQQKVQESYGNGFLGDLARFAGDVGYQGGKIGASIGLNALAPYSGTALYFSDIYGDQYQQNINEGMDNETAMLNAFAKTGQNYVKQWLIGGLGGKILGKTDASWLEKTLSSEWAKVASDPRVVSILSSMSAEALDEFTDTYMETLIDAFSKKDSNLGDLLSSDTLLEALYSAAVGGATGATGGFNANSMATAQNAINQRAMANINQQQNVQPEMQQNITPQTPQIEQNTQDNINNQPIAETPNIEPNEANNEQITKPEQLSLDLSEEQPSQQPIEQNNNLAETKSEDVIKATNKETSKKVSTDLNEAINGNDTQNIKQTIKSIEEETGKKMRSWVETATTSTGTTELVNSMNKQKITYEPTSNKKNLEAANKELSGMNYEQKLAKAKEIINSDKRLNSTDIAVLETVIQEAQTSGKMNDFMDLVQDTAILGTESGQVVQALSLIRQSDPTTQLSTLQKLIEREQAKGNKIYDGVKIKEDLVENVLNSYNEDGTWSKEKFDNAMYQLKQDIVNQMNVRPSEKFTAWRYLSMLGNPKTHIRNIVANVFMKLLQEGKDKVASGIESITPMNALNNLLNTKVKWNGLKTEIKKGNTEATRGHTLRKSTQEVKNYANTTIDNYFNEHKQTSKYNDNIRGLKSELESQRKIFSEKTPVGQALNKLEKANAKALDIEDVKFNKATTRKAFANFLTANGIETQEDIDNNPELVAQGLEYALFKGNEATFHQYSTTGTMLRNARESLRQGSNLSRIGGLAMDATMPFINTPINIAKTGIEYTPGIGMIKTISDVASAPKGLKADVFIDSLSKQFAGGALAAVGYVLAKEGIINAKGGEDKEDKLEKNLGKQDYSINLLGQTFDLSWLSPSAMPLFVGAELQKATDGKGISPEMAMNLLTSTIDPLSEMSVISSVTDALKSYSQGTQALGDIGSSALTSYISQYVPTLSSQIATLFDETQRSSSGNTLGEKIKNQAMYKLPGLRNMLPAQVDVWGEEKKYSENPIIRFAEAFFSPANRKEVKIDDTTKEIERVYENTGSGLPSLSITKTPKIDDVTYNLNSKEYIQYKKDYGKNAKDMLDDLVKQDKYKNADDAEKASMISAIYQYSTYMARKKIAEENNMKFEYKQSDGKGYNFPKYYLQLSKDEFAKYIANKNNK